MLDYEYLMHLIYCAVHGTEPQEKPEEVSFKNVFEIGRVHEVANIAFLSIEKLKNKPEPKLYEEWKINYYFSYQRNARQRVIYNTVIEALHNAGIRTLEAQGTVTKTLYPLPEMRMMSDIDLIIDIENLDKAMQLMSELGYSISQKQPTEFDAKSEKGELIEFHTLFFNEYMFNRRERYASALDSPFSHASCVENDKLSYRLNDDYFYLYFVIHIIAHFETAGCGIRRILDLYFLKKSFDDKVDMSFISSVIDKNGLRESLDKLFALEGEWFEDISADFDLTETKRDVLFSGNHGAAEIFTRNNVRKDLESGIKFARLKRIINFVFPKKEYIYLEFPVCKERGYSTFICQLYRIGSKIKKLSFSHAIYQIKTIIKSK